MQNKALAMPFGLIPKVFQNFMIYPNEDVLIVGGPAFTRSAMLFLCITTVALNPKPPTVKSIPWASASRSPQLEVFALASCNRWGT